MATLALHRQPLTGLLDNTSVGSGAGLVGSTLSYDSHGELIELGWSVGGTSYFHEQIGRDTLGRIVRIDETMAGVTNTRLYGYDAAGRLASVTEPGSPGTSRSWEYDDNLPGNGNRTRERDGTGAELAVAGYDDQDRLAHYGGALYAWTAAGELSQRTRAGDTLSTTYDVLGNLVSARLSPDILSPLPDPPPPVAGRLIRYRSDAQGRRVQRLVNGVVERGWLYRDALAPVAELDGTGAVTCRYVYGTMDHSPDLLLRADTAFRVITDHLGSVRAVVRLTDGAVVQRLDHDAWGNVTASYDETFQSLGYAGGLADPDTRLVRFGARDYDPSVGRWTAKDPIGFAGGSLSLFAYAWGDPVDFTDSNGQGGFRKRPLDFPPLEWIPVKLSSTKQSDACDCEWLHEQYFADNGENWGYFKQKNSPLTHGPSEIRPDDPRNRSKYTPEPAYYDDETMRKARDNIAAIWLSRELKLSGNNCQHYADALRQEYARLMDGPLGNH